MATQIAGVCAAKRQTDLDSAAVGEAVRWCVREVVDHRLGHIQALFRASESAGHTKAAPSRS